MSDEVIALGREINHIATPLAARQFQWRSVFFRRAANRSPSEQAWLSN